MFLFCPNTSRETGSITYEGQQRSVSLIAWLKQIAAPLLLKTQQQQQQQHVLLFAFVKANNRMRKSASELIQLALYTQHKKEKQRKGTRQSWSFRQAGLFTLSCWFDLRSTSRHVLVPWLSSLLLGSLSLFRSLSRLSSLKFPPRPYPRHRPLQTAHLGFH